MAYKVSLQKQCRFCNRQATHEVFNNRNASHGFFCSKHADNMVRDLRREEERGGKDKN